MTQEFFTLELAKLYESQGHCRDAYEIYLGLENEHSSAQVQAGINRMEMKLAMEPEIGPKEKTAGLLEKWLELIVLKHRLGRFKHIKSRLV